MRALPQSGLAHHTICYNTTHDNMQKESATVSRRDYNLDIYRGCVMLYIVGFVHIISIYFNWYTHTPMTLALIEMPVVFYIAGAAHSLAKERSYGSYVVGRMKRIVIPLVIFLLFAVVMMSVRYGTSLTYTLQSMFPIRYDDIMHGKFLSQSHLWFLCVYVVMALLLPAMHYASKRMKGWMIYVAIAVMLGVLYIYPSSYVGYMIPCFMGLYYRKAKPYNRFVLGAIAIGALALCMAKGFSWNMQINKFPTNLMFIAYTSLALLVLARPLQWVCLRLGRLPIVKDVIMQYAHHDLSIYLYHIPIIMILNYCYAIVGSRLPFLFNDCISYPIMAVTTIVVMIGVGRVADRINDAVISAVEWLGRKLLRR